MEQHQFGLREWAGLCERKDATIAALQARVQELEQWVQDQSTANLETMRHTDEMQSRAMEAEQQLTQRTAELEAANKRVMDERNLSNSWMKKHDELLAKVHKSGQFGAVVVQDVLKERDTRQAELERVRGERDEANELVAALSSKVAEYEVELNGDPQNFYGRGRTVGLRTLILALPQMEGQWEILEGRNCGETVWIVGDGGMFFEKDAAIAHDALLKHRQGMEG